jgi:hypothetical protein
MANAITLENKNYVAIGKMIFSTSGVEWTIPHLHFMVEENTSGHFEAINLEFGLVSSADTSEEATNRLGGLIHFHITAVMNEGNGYEEFKDTAKSNFMEEYWQDYRFLDFSLCERGISLSSAIEERIKRAIQDMFSKQVKEIITQKANETADDIIKIYEKMSSLNLVSVQYTELDEAA